MKHIDLQDFKELFESRTLPEMQTSVYQCIAQFFTIYKSGENYIIDGDKEELDNYFYGCYDLYAKFGIYSNLAVPNIFPAPQVICYVINESELSDKIANYEAEYGSTPDYVVNMTDDIELNRLLKMTLPNCTIMNKSSMINDYVAEKTVNTHRNYDIYEYVDLTEKFLNVSKKYISINFCLKEYRNLLNEIRALEHSSRTVFYIDSNIDQRVRFLYVCVASILTFESFNFEIPDDLSMVYISNLQKIQDRNYMILPDYLRKIANPVSIGISLYGVRAYVCVLNHEPGESVYKQKDFELSMITTEVDDSLALVGGELERVTARYSDMEILDIIESYGLDSSVNDFDTVLSNHKRLTDILTEFEEEIVQLVSLSNTTTLNFTNTLLYKMNGKKYLAFVTKIPDLQYDYTFIPICPKYRQFRNKLSVVEYDRIYDINVFAEKDVLLKKFDRYCFGDHRHFEKPRFLDGMIISTAMVTKEIITPDTGFNFPEVGIWSSQSSNGRIMALQFLLTRFNRIELHNKRFLSFWGGCHPMDLTHLTTDYKIWKGEQDD